jgi:hypothetical protein
MVVNSYRATNPDASTAAANEAREYTAGGVPAHTEYNALNDMFDVVTDRPGQQHARTTVDGILGR